MATATAIEKTSVNARLDGGFEAAVVNGLRMTVDLDVRRVGVEDQKRDVGRLHTCQMSMLGDGWFGSLVLLFPADHAAVFAGRARGEGPPYSLKGAHLAEGFGMLAGTIGIQFARDFAGEDKVTIGMPTVMTGQGIAVMFPWGKDFESRQSFQSDLGPFWAILRLSRLKS